MIGTAARASIFLLCVLTSFACSPRAPTLVKYQKNNVSFAHNSDWKVTSDSIVEESTNSRVVDLEGPNDALISILIMPATTELTLANFAAEVEHGRTAAIKETLSIGSFSAAKVSSGATRAISGEVGGTRQSGIRQVFIVTVLGAKVPHEAGFFEVSGSDKKAFIMTQVAAENANKMAPGIATTLSSLRLQKSK